MLPYSTYFLYTRFFMVDRIFLPNFPQLVVSKGCNPYIYNFSCKYNLLTNYPIFLNELWHIWLGGGKGYFRHSSKLFYKKGIAVGQPPISYHFWVCRWTSFFENLKPLGLEVAEICWGCWKQPQAHKKCFHFHFFKLLQVVRLMAYLETLNRHQNFSLALRRPRPRKSGIPPWQPQSTFSKKCFFCDMKQI